MIWSYWEGPQPQHIETCLRSMENVLGRDFCLVTPKTLSDYISADTLHPNFRDLPQPALKADCVRSALLATHGGWWFDADTIAIQHPDSLYKLLDAEAIYMVWDSPPVRVLNGYIYFAPGSSKTTAWLESVNQSLEKGPSHPSWCSLGEGVLTDLLYEANGAAQVSRAAFLPIDIDSNVDRFFTPTDPTEYIKDSTVCFGLNHSWFMYHHPREMSVPKEEWRNNPLMIHRLLQWSEEQVR